MSNVQAPSVLDASVAPAVGITSQLDASQLDKNLRQIELVHSSWSLPRLPDDVKLDLASQPGVNHVQLNTFLNGISADLNGDGIPDSQQQAQGYTPPVLENPGSDNQFDQVRRIFGGVANQAPPTVVTGDAVKQWKMSAIASGDLSAPADGQVDSTWDPSFETIRKQMAYNQTNDAYRGDRSGSIPFAKAIDLLGKWTMPTGLMAAATKLDLWWDGGAIKKEFNTWGDKWRKLGKSSNPLDFAKNLVDAITGPLDDVLVPAANWALLLTGVSEAYDFGKIAMMGADAIKGSEAVEGLYSTSRLPGFLQGYKSGEAALTDVNAFGESSGLANRLGKADNAVANWGSRQMDAWRDLKGVGIAKKTVSIGMRLGVAEQAESQFLPNYHGENLPGTQRINKALTWVDKNPILSNVINVALVPYSSFRPGTFTGTAKSLVKAGGTALGTAPGRAVAGALIGGGYGAITGHDLTSTAEDALIGGTFAAGAPVLGKVLEPLASKSKFIGYVSDVLEHASWKPMTDNQQLTYAFHTGMTNYLSAFEPEKLAAYTEGVKKDGFLPTFADHLGVDVETASAAMGFTTISAAIDHIASSQAAGLGEKVLHDARNKIISQISGIDISNPTESTLKNIAVLASRNTVDPASEFERLMKAYKLDPELALQYAGHHNDMAKDMLRQLLSTESLPELNPGAAKQLYGWGPDDMNSVGRADLSQWTGSHMTPDDRLNVISKYLPQVMDKFGRWPTYTGRMTELRQLTEGGQMDDAFFSLFQKPDGTMADIYGPKKALKTPKPLVATNSQEISKEVNSISIDPTVDHTKSLAGTGDHLSRPNPDGKFTLSRNPPKQYFKSLQAEMVELLRAHQTVNNLPRTLADVASDAGKPLDDLTRDEFASLFTKTVTDKAGVETIHAPTTKQAKALRALHDFAKRNNIDLDGAMTSITNRVNEAVDDPRITDTAGLGRGVRGKPVGDVKQGPLLTGADALNARIGQLSNKAYYTAAEIDSTKLIDDLALKHGHDTFTMGAPELGDARPGEYFHGSSGSIEKFNENGAASSNNLFGPGVYTTDTPRVALTYVNKGEGTAPSVYRVLGKDNPKVMNLDVPQPELNDSIMQHIPEGMGDNVMTEQLYSLLDSSTPASDVYKQFKTFLLTSDLSTVEIDRTLQDVNDHILSKGYDAMSYAGGVRTSNEAHNVTIWLKQGDVKIAENVSDKVKDTKLITGRVPNYDHPDVQAMQSYVTGLENDGYKLAHGVQFLMPEALNFATPLFEDIGARHLNAATLGSFFKGKLPQVAAEAAKRRSLLAIADELEKSGSKLNTSIDGPDVLNAYKDIRSVMYDAQNLSKDARNDAAQSGWLAKRTSAIRPVPITLADLRTKEKAVMAYLEPRYGEQDARAMYKSLARMRNTDFKDVGLAAIENKLRTNNQLSNGLKILAGTNHAEAGTDRGFEITKNILDRTSTGRKVGAVAGAVYATQTNKDGNDWVAGLEGGAIGAGLGTAAQGVVSLGAQPLSTLFDNSNLFRYGYIADNLARVRDTMRFTLSPFFDLSRYTEGTMLGHTAAPLRAPDGSRLVMPGNMSPSSLTREWSKAAGGGTAGKLVAKTKFNTLLDDMARASHGDFAPQAIGQTNEWFQQVGILGFNPTNWMGAAFHHLREAGFDAEQAWEHTRNMYTYGTQGRSAFEQSVNTLFFPFSFQKKTLGHLTKYLADDMSRAIILHDGLKAYEMLDKHYDLSRMWKDHFPALEELQRLNLFAYGLSAGKLGGINRQFIEPLVGAATNLHGKSEFVPGIFNLFNPNGVSIKSAEDGANIQKLTRSLLPVMNDINTLTKNLIQQKNVIFSPSHQTEAADANDGWNAWNQYKTGLNVSLKSRGLKFSDLSNKSWLADENVQYKAEQARIGAKFPGWGASRLKSNQNFAALNIEKQDRLNRVDAGIGTETDNMMATFEDALKPIRQQMAFSHITDPLDISPDIFQSVQDLGVKYAKTSIEWRNLWKKFYEKDWGIIEAQVQG